MASPERERVDAAAADAAQRLRGKVMCGLSCKAERRWEKWCPNLEYCKTADSKENCCENTGVTWIVSIRRFKSGAKVWATSCCIKSAGGTNWGQIVSNSSNDFKLWTLWGRSHVSTRTWFEVGWNHIVSRRGFGGQAVGWVICFFFSFLSELLLPWNVEYR